LHKDKSLAEARLRVANGLRSCGHWVDG
jgi:hypothetical protein